MKRTILVLLVLVSLAARSQFRTDTTNFRECTLLSFDHVMTYGGPCWKMTLVSDRPGGIDTVFMYRRNISKEDKKQKYGCVFMGRDVFNDLLAAKKQNL